MESGESSPHCFIQTQTGDDSPHSIRCRAPGKRTKTMRIGVNPLYPRHPRPINPYTDLKTALNVFRDEMSVVGPRPHIPYESETGSRGSTEDHSQNHPRALH